MQGFKITRFVFGPIAIAIMVAAIVVPTTQAMSQTPAGAFNNHCRTCHSLKPNDNRFGPSLHDIANAKAGSVAGYSYSSTLSNSQVVWDRSTMDQFLRKPEIALPGNKMRPFAGIPDAQVRGLILDHLGY